MHMDSTEKKWLILTLLLTLITIGVLAGYSIRYNIDPPSNVETIDSATLHLSKEFGDDNLGLKQEADGSYTVTMVAARYAFYPQNVTVPVNTPVKFRIASADVLHGMHTAYTNLNTMVVPGYVSQVTTTFPKEGDYPMFCNEYCGLGHDYMWAKLHVVKESELKLKGAN